MQKYAFLINVPGAGEDYRGSFDDGEWLNQIIGLDGLDKAVEEARKLISEGCSLINLCGDFGREHVEEMMKDAPEGTEVHFAAYLPSEQKKLEALEQFVEYGQIIFGGVDEPVRIDLRAPAVNTHTIFVRDLEQAKEAAEELTGKNPDGIELCSGFDGDMTKEIIAAVEAVDPSIPVGSCGITL